MARKRREFLGGQSWSLITPNHKGLSPLPADVFYSYDVDANYQAGIPWGRFRRFGLSGTRPIRLPGRECATVHRRFSRRRHGDPAGKPGELLTNQLGNGTNSFSLPTLNPDIISKLAWDPMVGGLHWHVETAGMLRSFRIFNSLTDHHFASIGGSGSFNSNLELIKGDRLQFIENFYAGRGVGDGCLGRGLT